MKKKIYYHDTDCGGVVYYANYLKYLEEARTEFLEEKGVSVKTLADEGTLFVVVRQEIDYKAPAVYGDVLEIKTYVPDISRIKIEFGHEIKNQTEKIISMAKTIMVCVDNKLKPKTIPDEIRGKIVWGDIRNQKPGEYKGGFWFTNIKGAEKNPIIIAAANEKNLPVIKGGSGGMVIGSSAYLELRDLIFIGQEDHGVHIHDDGKFDKPSHHIVLRNLKIKNTGSPRNNSDGIKLSGVDDLWVLDCTIEYWVRGGSDDGGSGIDMMGCR